MEILNLYTNRSQLPYELEKFAQYINGYKNSSIIKLINDLHEDKKKVRILDFGCGRGELLKVLKENGYDNIFGIDFDKHCVELSSGFAKVFGSVEEFKNSINNELVDVVILSQVMEHLQDPAFTLREIKSVTKKFIIIAVPNPLATITLFRALIRKPESGHCTHFWSWEAGELRNFLEVHNNLKIIKWTGDYVSIFPYGFASKVLPDFMLVCINRFLCILEAFILRLIFPFFVCTLICLCEKQD